MEHTFELKKYLETLQDLIAFALTVGKVMSNKMKPHSVGVIVLLPLNEPK